MGYTLTQLDAMSIEEANALSFEDRDALLDLIITDGRKQTTSLDSYRIGLYGDYFEEDLLRMLKVRAVKVFVRGTTPSGFDGEIVGDTDEDQYRAAFRHVQMSLEAAGTSYSRVTTLVIFLTDMSKWPPAERGVPRVHPQPALQGCHRHNRFSPVALANRDCELHCLSRGVVG